MQPTNAPALRRSSPGSHAGFVRAPPRFRPGNSTAILADIGTKVEGRIAREGVSKSGAIRFLNFEGTERGDLTLVFFVKSNAENDTQENLAAYIGKIVRATGQVSRFGGTPQIVIHSFSQLSGVPGAYSSSPK
jgi:DNA/RNA endonuclease YhcR with UshA esterase domain